jgi:hypothetical protein
VQDQELTAALALWPGAAGGGSLLDFSTPKFKEQSQNVYENKGK